MKERNHTLIKAVEVLREALKPDPTPSPIETEEDVEDFFDKTLIGANRPNVNSNTR